MGRPFTGAWIETHQAIQKRARAGRPFTGAWIETEEHKPASKRVSRRPFTGAWIETQTQWSSLYSRSVAPSPGRGLKLLIAVLCFAARASPLHRGVD